MNLQQMAVIFSCVRAAGSKGIGFLSDVRRMNVALTRAKFFLFVIARCSSIVVNPYWRDLVEHACETDAVIRVPFSGSRQSTFTFPDLCSLKSSSPQWKRPSNERESLDDVEELQKKIKKLLDSVRRITSLRVERLQRRLQSLSFQSKVSLESQRVDFYEENLKNYNPTSDSAYNLGVRTLQRLESYLKQRLI